MTIFALQTGIRVLVTWKTGRFIVKNGKNTLKTHKKLPKRLVNNFFLLTFADPIELTSVRL